jgi:glycosyltransferase involved in cell wall biosynthesis
MRLALASREYPPETAHGGIGSQTYLKAHGLSARGHEVYVISGSVDGERHEYRDGDVQVIRIPGFEGRMPIYTEPAEWLTYSAEVAAAVAGVHARVGLDLVDFPEWGAEGYVHLLNRTEWNRIPTVVHIHGPLVMFAHTVGWPNLESEFYRVGTQMEGTCLRLADAVFSSSSCSADWCARHYGLTRARIPVLHTGVDTRLFRPCNVPKETRPTIIFVGRITGDKGALLLVDAACELAKEFPDLRLRMLGRGDSSLLEELRAKAASRGLTRLLDLPGFVRREELPRHLSAAHVFAGPSAHEPGPGLVYLEAMACGLPAVACDGAGAAEVVIPEQNGVLVPPGDRVALAEALRRLISDERAREAMGARARCYVLEHADSDRCLERIEAFYASVVG